MAAATSLHSTLGAIEVGINISLAMFGIVLVQGWTYFRSDFMPEGKKIHTLVIWCLLIEFLHTIFICIYFYETTVRHIGDFEYLPKAQWPLSFSVALSAFVSTPVQLFFTYRVYLLSRSRIYPSVLTVASIARLGWAIAGSVLAYKSRTLMEYQTRFLGPGAAAIGAGSVIDMANTGTLIYFIVIGKGDVSSSPTITEMFLVWVCETGLITSIASLSSVVMLISMPHNAIWLCPLIFVAKLYSCSFLVFLNRKIAARSERAFSHTVVSLADFIANSDAGTSRNEDARPSKAYNRDAAFGYSSRHTNSVPV